MSGHHNHNHSHTQHHRYNDYNPSTSSGNANSAPPAPPPRQGHHQGHLLQPDQDRDRDERPRTPSSSHHHTRRPHREEDSIQRSSSPYEHQHHQHQHQPPRGRDSPEHHFERPHQRGPPIGAGGFFQGRGMQQPHHYFHDDFEWPDDDMDQRFFSRGPRGFPDAFRGFPHTSGFPEMRSRVNVDPREEFYYRQQHPQQHPHHGQEHVRSASPSANVSGGSVGASIPIRVVHERSGSRSSDNNRVKHPHSSRNTTDLPARASPTPDSPRLERARSEPPKNFAQKLSQARQHQPNYASIPENEQSHPHQQHHQQQSQGSSSGLNVPSHNLSTSASSPSVPSRQPHNSAPPQPPPRRGSPTKSKQEYPTRGGPESPDLRKQSAPPGVRHIPIFVEGSKDPVVSRRRQQQHNEDNPDSTPSFMHKPSDFYPSGTHRVARGSDVNSQPQPEQQPRQRPTTLPEANRANKMASGAEPTSPLSPPSGPIPMGCSPSHLNVKEAVNQEGQEKDGEEPKKEPTSPMPAPKGPIPMPCSPDLLGQVHDTDNEDTGDSKEAPTDASHEENEPCNEDNTRDNNNQKEPVSGPEGIAIAKMDKVKDDVAKLVERIEKFKGNKKDKEYLILDEMLTRHLLSLDGVDTCGQNNLRQMRKDSIKAINRCLSMLDSKARGKSAGQEGEGNADKEGIDDAASNNAVLTALANLSSS